MYCQSANYLYLTVEILIFLFDFQRTNLLLQRSPRQSYWPSLYLDTFGEEVIACFLSFSFINEHAVVYIILEFLK